MDDRILLTGLSFHGHTGVYEEEKRNGQTFVLDLELDIPHIRASETDDLDDTVNYADVYRAVRDIVEQSRFDLIERLAGRIAEALLESFPMVQTITVTVKKPEAPVDGVFDHMAVRIERSREVGS